MAFATRSKYFWSRFIATCVKYLGVANTQHLRYLAEKILPTEMSRQNILYHVRIAEEKGWIATFASSLEMNEENKILFRMKFVDGINEKISAQRFVIIGTESFEAELEAKIKSACQKAHMEPISILDNKILTLITEDSLKRLSSTQEKSKGNKSLFMVLLRFGWFWLNINPIMALKIVEILKNNADKHNYNDSYKIDVELLEIVSLIEQETLPELGINELKELLIECIKIIHGKKRKDLMNLMAMVLLISSRVLIALNKLSLAEEYLNRGIKYLRLSTRKSILMRKLHVDGLFDLGFIYSQQGWFYKALGVYENIERIINEEFISEDPTDNLKGRLAYERSELFLMMAWPAYTFKDEDYRSSLLKSLKYARQSYRIYLGTNNKLKVAEINLLSAWICALLGKITRAEFYLNKGTKGLIAPVPAKLNALYYNALAEIYRKQEKYDLAIKNISLSFDYLKMLGYLIFKLFSMTRLAAMHIQLANKNNQISIISYGDMTILFEKGVSDMISHVFLDFNKQLLLGSALISFYADESVLKNHPETNAFVNFIESNTSSSILLGESFSLIPASYISEEILADKKITCIAGLEKSKEKYEEYNFENFKEELRKFDEIYQTLLSKG